MKSVLDEQASEANNVNGKTGVIWVIDAAYVLKGSKGKIDYINLRRKCKNGVYQKEVGLTE